MMRPLNERERAVLTAVIEEYTESAEPVGSRTLSRKYFSDLSPATIRNTMYDLEELGLLAQPHTSAGREPTAAGYRLYLNTLMKPPRITTFDRRELDQLLEEERATRDEDTVLLHVAQALANISHLISLAFFPSFDDAVLEKIDLLPISENRVLAILQVRSGTVDTVTITLPEPVRPESISETARALNERLSGETIGRIRRTIGERLRGLSYGDQAVINVFLNEGDGIFDLDARAAVVLEGRPHILNQPEFTDRTRLSDLMRVLEDRPLIRELRRSDSPSQVQVSVGEENNIEALATCSLITRGYHVGNLSGTLAIVGPMRMSYPRLLAVLEHAGVVTERLLS
jgi:heat-inducible transcriptional repressor